MTTRKSGAKALELANILLSSIPVKDYKHEEIWAALDLVLGTYISSMVLLHSENEDKETALNYAIASSAINVQDVARKTMEYGDILVKLEERNNGDA